MSAAVDPYRDSENLRWELLGDCVFEDAKMLFEVFGAVRAHFPEIDDQAVAQLTEKLLRDLLSHDLVYFYRDSGGTECLLDAVETDAVLKSSDWRGLPASGEAVTTWVAATEAGVAAAHDPPDHIRELWQWPPRPWKPANGP